MYIVTKTINGNDYLYEQETYRDENGVVRTRNRYIGPARPKRRLLGAIMGMIQDAARNKQLWLETPQQLQARMEAMQKAWDAQRHINEILTAPSITLEQFEEVIEFQHPGYREDTPQEAEAIRSEVETVPEFAPSDDASPTLSEQPAEAAPSEDPSEPSMPSEHSPSDVSETASPV